jgi:hypothetical protein
MGGLERIERHSRQRIGRISSALNEQPFLLSRLSIE